MSFTSAAKMKYRIDWDEFSQTWWAVSKSYPSVHARHPKRDSCIKLITMRCEVFCKLSYIVNNMNGDTEVRQFTIEDINVDLGSALVYQRLNAIDLDIVPRADLVKLFKDVDRKIEQRQASDFDWYWSYLILSRYLDPFCVLRWPDPEWCEIGGGE